MTDFILEEQINKIKSERTPTYVKEVASCYYNGNYRACVAVLYTTVVYDLLDKLMILKKLYNDKNAISILNSLEKLKSNNQKSSEWESKLLDEIYSKTKLLTATEYEDLKYLKDQRNLAAHPIIDIVDDEITLKEITKEKTADLIRSAFESVFLKDAMIGQNIIHQYLDDIDDYYNRHREHKMKEFLQARYFNRLSDEKKSQLFRNLWKCCFCDNSPEAIKHLTPDVYGLFYLYESNNDICIKAIKKEPEYFSQLKYTKANNTTSKSKLNVEKFQRTNSLYYLCKLFEYSPELLKAFGPQKELIKINIMHLYTPYDLETVDINSITAEEKNNIINQFILYAESVFISDECQNHFNSIKRIMNKFCHDINKNWYSTEYYKTYMKINWNSIYRQVQNRCNTIEFINFIIDIIIHADTYDLAYELFEELSKFFIEFQPGNFKTLLIGIKNNNQFYDNFRLNDMLQYLDRTYQKIFKKNILISQGKMDKYTWLDTICQNI